jgi:aspartyl-tRNA(Asn)/glutamyl-tRNA(Gln) amidotransferase subunit B
VSWLATIGLEIHVQLKTESKMFCACAVRHGDAPNTHVCPVCLGYPGALPTINGAAVRMTAQTGLMLGCDVQLSSKFDRKSYFYPDVSKNYQISQYDKPICLGGGITLPAGEGRPEPRRIRLARIHLEEDVAKNIHHARCSGIDFNRSGVPLMEIVTEPDLRSPEETFDFLHVLKETLLCLGVSDCNLEEGNLRCDVNVSLRASEEAPLGTKSELKNLNTFKGVRDALRYEIDRQAAILDGGGRVMQETRRWDAESGATFSMRTKEDAHDYRYFPDPDLLPVLLEEAQVEAWRKALPELPAARRERMAAQYGLTGYDAGVLVQDKALADYFELAASTAKNPKILCNVFMGDVMSWFNANGFAAGTEAALSGLVNLSVAGTITGPTLKELLPEVLSGAITDPARVVEERGLGIVADDGALEAWVDEAIARNPGPAADFRAGKKSAAGFFVGQVMKSSNGKADPRKVAALVAKRLAEQP